METPQGARRFLTPSGYARLRRRETLTEDFGEPPFRSGVLDLSRDPTTRGEAGFHEVRVRTPRNEQVRPRHDPGGDLEDLELEVLGHDPLDAKGADHAAEQLDRPLHDPTRDLEGRGSRDSRRMTGTFPVTTNVGRMPALSSSSWAPSL